MFISFNFFGINPVCFAVVLAGLYLASREGRFSPRTKT